MKKITFLVVCVGLQGILLASCNNMQTDLPDPGSTLNSYESNKMHQTETVTPLLTETPREQPTTSPIPQLTALPTKTKSSPSVINCMGVEEKVLGEMSLSGIWVLEIEDEESQTDIVLVDLGSGIEKLLERSNNERISDVVVSPNGYLLAYRLWIYDVAESELLENKIVISDATGNSVATYIAPFNFDQQHPVRSRIGNWESFYWIDDQHLAINVFQTDLPTAAILDVFSGETQIIRSDFPKIDPLADLSVPWDFVTIFDNTISYVMYVGQDDDDFGPALVLYDRDGDQISFLRKGALPFGRPQWSPDFMTIVYAGGMDTSEPSSGWELFVVDREGNNEQLTELNDVFSNVAIGKYNWSPDGRLIAFWFTYKVAERLEKGVGLVNVTTKETSIFCPTGIIKFAAIWSPDSSELVFNHYPEDTFTSSLLILDVYRDRLIALMDGRLLGWMDGEP